MAKSFDTYMAETGQQLVLDDLRRNFQYDKAKSDYERAGYYGSGGKQTGDQGYGSTPGSSINFNSILDQVKGSINSSLSPIIAKLESQAPAISKAYEGAKTTLQQQKSSLSDKYSKLLQDIRNTGKRQSESAIKTTGSELARRGITGDSTAAQQELQATTAPIDERVLAATNQATAAQGDEESAIANALANLSLSEQSAQSGVLQQVANLLSGGASQATGLASNLYSQLLSAEQSGKTSPEQIASQQLQNRLLEQQLRQSEQLAPLQLQQLQAQIKKLLQPAQASFSGDLSSFW